VPARPDSTLANCNVGEHPHMSFQLLLIAVALMLVFEGILPFLAPGLWRETFRRLIEMSDGQIRFIGLTSMLIGLLILFFVKW
jgi:uncharacterized protein